MPNQTRKASVSGLFYPSQCKEIKSSINKFNQLFEKLNIDENILSTVPRAVIVPHAGYIYSGFTANMAYRFLNNAKPKRIIVIGPSHHHYFKGISGSYYENYETPCGNISIDSIYLFALAKEFNISFIPEAHIKEHSTEVQMPFIKHYFKNTKVIELIYSDIDTKNLAKIIFALLSNPDNLIVVSSDLSHFHTLEVAKQHDNICMKAIKQLSIEKSKKGCEACGLIGIQALILAAKKSKLKSELLDYKTSAKTNGDENSVVGYLSAIFY